MGTTLSGIHIYSHSAPVGCGFSFRSFSAGWQTCTDDFSRKDPDYPYQAARFISKRIDAPVFYFEIFDSEMIRFEFLRNGKVVSRYSDEEFVQNKKLFDIPPMIGYTIDGKRRLSRILGCADADLKTAMLEEYLGVCLLYEPELSEKPEQFRRERSDALYRKYQEQEKALTGNAAPIRLNLIAEYPGKLFWHVFGASRSGVITPHCFLYGYAQDHMHDLTPVRFTGKSLEPCDPSVFAPGQTQPESVDPRFRLQYGTPDVVTFTDACPPAYRGKSMKLPSGFYPAGFTKADELLLTGNHRICVVDDTLKIVAKLSVKGDFADVVDDGILTTSGDSFCGYCFDPNAKVRIYEIIRKSGPSSRGTGSPDRIRE